jgi:hypothetical protein
LSIGPTDRIHAAEEDHIRLLGLDLGQNRLEVGRLVGGELARDDRRTGRLGGLLDLVGQTLAIGRTVVDDRNLLGAQSLTA